MRHTTKVLSIFKFLFAFGDALSRTCEHGTQWEETPGKKQVRTLKIGPAVCLRCSELLS